MPWKRLIVADRERILIARNGRFAAILLPGEYRFPGLGEIEIEKHDLRDLVFRSSWDAYLIHQRPELVERHFVKVETSETEVGLVYVNGSLYQALTPSKRLLFWRDAAAVSAEVVDVIPALI
jgi:hypothetical protein